MDKKKLNKLLEKKRKSIVKLKEMNSELDTVIIKSKNIRKDIEAKLAKEDAL